MSNNKKSFWVGALIGGIVGSVSALLFAPKSGRELRKDIAEGAQQVNERTQQWAKQIGDQTEELISAAKGKVASFKQGLNSLKQQDADEAQVAAISSLPESAAQWDKEVTAEANVEDGKNKEVQ